MLVGAEGVADVIKAGVVIAERVVAEDVIDESQIADHFPVLGADAVPAARRRRRRPQRRQGDDPNGKMPAPMSLRLQRCHFSLIKRRQL